MSQPQDFHTMLQQQLDHMETKTRLTQAEKLLRTCDTVIKRLTQTLATRSVSLEQEKILHKDTLAKLERIPLWIRRLFNAH